MRAGQVTQPSFFADKPSSLYGFLPVVATPQNCIEAVAAPQRFKVAGLPKSVSQTQINELRLILPFVGRTPEYSRRRQIGIKRRLMALATGAWLGLAS